MLKTKAPRKAAGGSKAHDRFWLWLLPFGPDPVPSRPLHRSRPLSTARRKSFYKPGDCSDLPEGFHCRIRFGYGFAEVMISDESPRPNRLPPFTPVLSGDLRAMGSVVSRER